MDRLIYKEADGDLTCRSRDFDKVFPTLYAYEETGFTPENIRTLEGNYDALHAENEALRSELAKVKAELVDERHRHDRYVDFELDESAELQKVKAERDRLAELWAKVPDTIKSHYNCVCAGEFAEDNNVPCQKED